MLKWKFLDFHLCQSPLFLSLGTTEKSLVVFFTHSHDVFICIDKIPLLSSRLNNYSSLTLSSYVTFSNPFSIFVASH